MGTYENAQCICSLCHVLMAADESTIMLAGVWGRRRYSWAVAHAGVGKGGNIVLLLGCLLCFYWRKCLTQRHNDLLNEQKEFIIVVHSQIQSEFFLFIYSNFVLYFNKIWNLKFF